MKPFENLTGLLEWLAEVYPERCQRITNAQYDIFTDSSLRVINSSRHTTIYVVDRESNLYVEYLLREIIEAESYSWELMTRGDSYYAVLDREDFLTYRSGSSPALALGSALREAKSA